MQRFCLALLCVLGLIAATARADAVLKAPASEPPECTAPDTAQRKLGALLHKLLPLTNTVAIGIDGQRALVQFLTERHYAGWCADHAPRTSGIRATGPIVRGPAGEVALSYGTHSRARVFYSKEVVSWLQNDRQGEIPDGAMIVKEMYPYPATHPTDSEELIAGWAVMLRDRASSHMGWIWGLYFVPGNPTFKHEYMTIQPGLSYCTTCHASTDNSQGTFSFLGNLFNQDVATYVQAAPVFTTNDSALTALRPPSLGNLEPHSSYERYLGEISETMYRALEPRKPLSMPNSAVLSMLRSQLNLKSLPRHADLKKLPLDFLYDRKVPHGGQSGDKGGDGKGRKKDTFYTSSACVGCHNAANLLNNTLAHGQLPIDPAKVGSGFVVDNAPGANWPPISQVNVTPYGEWQGSLMAMSGRDPIFRAQVEWEAASINDKTKSADVTQLCMSCHSVMGERENPELARDISHTYAYPDISHNSPQQGTGDAGHQFAALARDGVSCTVCHHISADGLGSPESFTANFQTGPADKIYGPFKDVLTQPMRNAVGLTPVGADHIKSSALCGSCHTIHLPVLHNDREVAKTYEQTTYLEWLNSSYSQGLSGGESALPASPTRKSCQDCHMTGVNPVDPEGPPLDLPVANIEDSSFPYVPNRAAPEALDVKSRADYRRHTLVGANLFGLNMFEQFPDLLGAHLFWPGQDPTVMFSRTLAIEETRQQVQQRTASLAIVNVEQGAEGAVVEVQVNNLAGHKLPSGVGFRRAFLEFQLLDESGEPLWCSGCTNDAGVIVDAEQQPLDSEFPRTQAELAPDLSEISDSTQVQIYESRALDCDGRVTTSFVHICEEVKDNRLLPLGWRENGAYAEVTRPVGQLGETTPGLDVLRYRPPAELFAQAAEIRVVLNYQAIPPSYLVDRFRLLDKAGDYPELQRLLYLVLHLNTDSARGMKQWKTPVACVRQPIVFQGGVVPVAQNCI